MKPFTSIAVVVNGFEVPLWVSVVALIASWVLAAMVWRERRP